MNNDPKNALPTAMVQIPQVWSAHRRHIFTALLNLQLLVGMLLLFALIAVSLVWSAGQRLDAWVFLLLNLRGYRRKWLDRIMSLATQVGNLGTALFLASLFYFLEIHSLTIEILFGTITLWLLVETIKTLTNRTRPFLDLVGSRVIGWRERGRSFPSGHTSQTFFLVTLLCHRFQFNLLAILTLYGVALLVGFTRIYVGAHYPRDVIGGAILGCIWGVLLTLVDPYWLGMRF
jgi:membrane-associated phospholipid phosphatase